MYISSFTTTDTANGCTNCTVPVPVSLIYFIGEYTGENIELYWSTASELNNHYFELSRSFDGTNFETVGIVEGQGTTNSIADYNFTDVILSVAAKSILYRLEQVDYDGSSEVFFTQVNITAQLDNTVAYPNPFENQVTVANLNDREEYILELTDLTGAIIWSVTKSPVNERVTLDNSTSELPKGYYFLTIEGKSTGVTKRYKLYKLH